MQGIQRGTFVEDQVIAVLHLFEIELMIAAQIAPFLLTKEWNQTIDPLPSAGDEIVSREGIRDSLQCFGIVAGHKRVSTLLEAHPLLTQALGNPVVLVQT